MRRLLAFVAVAASLITLAVPALAPASAATITVTKVEMGTPPDIVHLNGGTFNTNVYMGPTTFTLSDMSTLLLYCVDINHSISLGVQSPSLTYHTDTLANYLSSYSATTQQQIAGLILTGLTMPYGTSMNPVEGGIWQKLGGIVTTGNGALQAQINAYGSSTVTYDPTKIRVYVSDDGKQSFASIAVPEPATWAMLILGFGAIGLSQRRSRSLSIRKELA